MTTSGKKPGRAASEADFRSLPPSPQAEETIASVDTSVVADPDAVRNVDQHHALRED
ncbi:hypothetical protein [Nocardioides sp. TF02-7]|uniref:hypothetical protein n=1 Tax=Nocardioides sp. TF02-7 TaxID=2917724 RepID=UPI001F06F97D|nr:hypothetical protein [Nocardioides sp. TF02-7]UMG91884.1 hypothetical protein MF408_17915 [Nocardioides sp. TF02-7]